MSNITIKIHKGLSPEKWGEFSLYEQLGNIGSEVGRALKWKGKDEKTFESAVLRALELFDLTMNDPRWLGRLKEIGRAREVFLDAVSDKREYGGSLDGLEKYFYHFAVLARRNL
ncbi:hypothetical protein KJ591_00015 [Patescibacteria group bacterium]|nr:hypothetical protein [Patescibacteria group bacterium]MBU4022747.1 hypothetical protein [Patescibacteria group bacterium]MBU4162085.1 hypothetical protein [Patescibacteria group bacterium]